LQIEIDRAPDVDQHSRLNRIINFIAQSIDIGEKELKRANELEKLGFVGFDAVHLACAESGNADVFLTVDARLLNRAKRLARKIHIEVANPLDWLRR
jgi:predicted nucleic acid-binding protein